MPGTVLVNCEILAGIKSFSRSISSLPRPTSVLGTSGDLNQIHGAVGACYQQVRVSEVERAHPFFHGPSHELTYLQRIFQEPFLKIGVFPSGRGGFESVAARPLCPAR